MYGKDVEALLNKIKSKDKDKDISDRVQEEICKKRWSEKDIKCFRKALQRDYEIGTLNDKMKDALPLCIAAYSLLINCFIFAFGNDFKEGYIVVGMVSGVLVLLIFSLIVTTIGSHKRKRDLKAVIDVLDDICDEIRKDSGEENKKV